MIILVTTLRTTGGRGSKPCMDLDFTHAIKTSGTTRKISRVCAVVTGRYCNTNMKKLHHQANNFLAKFVFNCSGLLFPNGFLVVCITTPNESTGLLTPEISWIVFKHLRSELNVLYELFCSPSGASKGCFCGLMSSTVISLHYGIQGLPLPLETLKGQLKWKIS